MNVDWHQNLFWNTTVIITHCVIVSDKILCGKVTITWWFPYFRWLSSKYTTSLRKCWILVLWLNLAVEIEHILANSRYEEKTYLWGLFLCKFWWRYVTKQPRTLVFLRCRFFSIVSYKFVYSPLWEMWPGNPKQCAANPNCYFQFGANRVQSSLD